MFNITFDEPHFNSMDSIMALCPGWFHTTLLKVAGKDKFHTSWMYEFRDERDHYYIQIKKELETGLIEVIYLQTHGECAYPMFNTFFIPEDAVKFVATLLIYISKNNGIKLSEINYDAIYRRSILK